MDEQDAMNDDFRRQMLTLGIVRYDEQATLWQAAKHCARTMGVPAAGVGAVLGAGAGSVTVPGLGAVPGYLAGMLAGLAVGTGACMAVNWKHKNELRRLLED